jgi:molecular chaperone GrpE
MNDDAEKTPSEYEIDPTDDGDFASDRVDELERKLHDAEARYLRALADYQNYQRRALLNEQEARAQGKSHVVQSVLTVLDHFDMALTLDPAKATADQVIGGVRVIREELVKVLQSNGVGIISPAADDEFNPTIHQAVMQQDAPNVAPGHIVATLQPGYTIATAVAGSTQDRVIRPAMVAVKPA